MKEINFQGKALPIHFGIRAINNFAKLQNSQFAGAVTSTESLSSLDSIVSLTTSGLNEGARRSKSDVRYTEDDVWDMFDDEPTLILNVSELFVEAIAPLTDKLGAISPKK
ncbi:MAG: hypothetical protein R3Y49_05600 [Rikenellaceae bacterium]